MGTWQEDPTSQFQRQYVLIRSLDRSIVARPRVGTDMQKLRKLLSICMWHAINFGPVTDYTVWRSRISSTTDFEIQDWRIVSMDFSPSCAARLRRGPHLLLNCDEVIECKPAGPKLAKLLYSKRHQILPCFSCTSHISARSPGRVVGSQNHYHLG